jgi:hypothetical protein
MDMVKIRPEDRLEQLKIFINSIYGNRERNPFQDLDQIEAIRKEGIDLKKLIKRKNSIKQKIKNLHNIQ